jgi:hypothetical protein
MDYLTNEFKKNTEEKYLNAKMRNQHNKDNEKKKKELNNLLKKHKNFNELNSTNNRQKEIVLYEYNRKNDQLFIMKIITVTLLVCLIITGLINYILPYEFIYLVLAIFIGLIIYVIYYMYFKNIGKSKRHWNKYVFSKPVVDFDRVQSLTETQIEDLDKKMDKELSKYLDDNSCSKSKPTSNPTPKK